MVSVNVRLRDAEIDHAVDLRAYTDNVVRRMIAVLNRADAKLFEELVAKLSRMTPENFTIERLDKMLDSVQAINKAAYDRVHKDLRTETRQLTDVEIDFERKLLMATMPKALAIFEVDVNQVHAAAMARPFQGNLLKGFIGDLSDKKARLLRTTIADGYVQNKTTDQIVREVRGTKANGFKDGILEISRRDAAAVVRTAIAHTSAFAQQKFYDANVDMIKGYLWVSTLDNRTTSECQIRDGLEYDLHFQPVGHSIPWGAGPGLLHWSCRSRRSAVAKSWRDMGVDLDEFTPSERASMDGQVPASITYSEWIEAQSAARQDQILGPTRGQLLREGGLDHKELFNARGEELTLDDLRKKHASAFKEAGL